MKLWVFKSDAILDIIMATRHRSVLPNNRFSILQPLNNPSTPSNPSNPSNPSTPSTPSTPSNTSDLQPQKVPDAPKKKKRVTLTLSELHALVKDQQRQKPVQSWQGNRKSDVRRSTMRRPAQQIVSVTKQSDLVLDLIVDFPDTLTTSTSVTFPSVGAWGKGIDSIIRAKDLPDPSVVENDRLRREQADKRKLIDMYSKPIDAQDLEDLLCGEDSDFNLIKNVHVEVEAPEETFEFEPTRGFKEATDWDDEDWDEIQNPTSRPEVWSTPSTQHDWWN